MFGGDFIAEPLPRRGRFGRAVCLMGVIAESVLLAAVGPFVGMTSFGARTLGDSPRFFSESEVDAAFDTFSTISEPKKVTLLPVDREDPAAVSCNSNGKTGCPFQKLLGAASSEVPEKNQQITNKAPLSSRTTSADNTSSTVPRSSPNTASSAVAESATMVDYVKASEKAGLDPAVLKHIAQLEQSEQGQEMAQLGITLGKQVLQQKEKKASTSSVMLNLIRQKNYPSFLNHLKYGKYDINACDDNNRSALHYAILHQAPTKVIEVILQTSNFDVNVSGTTGVTPLHLAASNGATSIVELLLRHPKINVNAQDADGMTPAHYAVLGDHLNVLHTFLKCSGAFCNNDEAAAVPEESLDQTAVSKKSQTLDLNIADRKGVTPLELALHIGRAHLIPFLVMHGASVTRPNQHGLSALHTALRLADPRCISALLYALQQQQKEHPFADNLFSQVDENGDSPLHYAIQRLDPKIVVKLVRAGAPLTVVNRQNYTPFTLAEHLKLPPRVLALLKPQ